MTYGCLTKTIHYDTIQHNFNLPQNAELKSVPHKILSNFGYSMLDDMGWAKPVSWGTCAIIPCADGAPLPLTSVLLVWLFCLADD